MIDSILAESMDTSKPVGGKDKNPPKITDVSSDEERKDEPDESSRGLGCSRSQDGELSP